ncbi:hypothetical protein EJB05_10061 [Eragrostis curvula]|uniref:Uncharacterized protein n=1 Tax=Eragrostis curvula TaxID=38414 RepID=A0A5J9W6H0_9POAL|nr:hypothetical protein EJB05_10061 [Eragrostis curvula]
MRRDAAAAEPMAPSASPRSAVPTDAVDLDVVDEGVRFAVESSLVLALNGYAAHSNFSVEASVSLGAAGTKCIIIKHDLLYL